MFPIIAALLIIGIFGALTYYIARRLTSSFRVRFPGLKTWYILVPGLFLCACMALGFLSSRLPLPSLFREILEFAGFCWMGIFIYLLIYTLFFDIIILISRLFSSERFKRDRAVFARGVAVIALVAITCTYGFCNARCIRVANYEIAAEGAEGLRIVLLSDLHLGSVGSESRIADIVSEVNSLEADVVCFAGDFFDTDFASVADPEGARRELLKLSAKYGVYMCPGNHDGGSTAKDMNLFAESCNIEVLNDEYVVIDGKIVLAGRLDRSSIGGYMGLKRGELSDVLEGAPKELFTIVLDHNPARWNTYENEADLVLSGHTHEGQIFPGSLVTGLMYDVDYGYGEGGKDRPDIIVSSGIGYWGLPMRVGTASEIVCIDTVKAEK